MKLPMLNSERLPVTGKRVQLMATCLCDAFYDEMAVATVQVLEYLGCTVEFPEGQTCCGQPAFNGGDWAASRKVVRHTVKTFGGQDPVVVPSGSCAAMLTCSWHCVLPRLAVASGPRTPWTVPTVSEPGIMPPLCRC